MGFWFRGRTFASTDRIRLASPLSNPAGGGGVLALLRPTANRNSPGGFYQSGGTGGYLLARDTQVNTDRLGVWRPLRFPALLAQAAVSGTPLTTGSFTPPAYSTLIAFSAIRRTSANPNASAITDSLGGTWTLIPSLDNNVNDAATVFMRLRAHYIQVGASPASMTVTSTSATAGQHGLVVIACEAAGIDWANVATGTGSAGAATATLSTAPNTNSMVVGAFFNRQFTSPITPPTGYTELVLGDVGTNGKIQVVAEDNTSGTALAWNSAGDNLCIAAAIEIRQPSLLQHSSAVWRDNIAQSVFAYSAGASEHYLGMDTAASIEKYTTTVPLDTIDSFAMGRSNLSFARGGATGDWLWLGILKSLPRFDLLDRVMRQQLPPTALAPWLSHLVPLTGRDVPQCILTGRALTLDSGTPAVATASVMQPQGDEEGGIALGVARRLLRVKQRNASGTSELTLDVGKVTEATAVIIAPPAAGGTSLGAAANGAALTTMTLPSAAPAQQGQVVLGTSLVDGVPQTQAGSVSIGAFLAASVWNAGTHESMWDDAQAFLAPKMDALILSADAGVPGSTNLYPLVTDPSNSGFTLSVLSSPAGLTINLVGTTLNYSASAEADYQAVVRVTSLHPLAPVTDVPVTVSVREVASRFSNGYKYAADIRFPIWSSGTVTNFLVPIAEVDPLLKSVANGGAVEHASGFDIRVETDAGVKVPHRILRWDGLLGRLWLLVNFARDFGAAETLRLFIGKPGLTVTEEDTAGTRAGGWLAWNLGDNDTDFTGLGRPWTSTVSVTPSTIGPFPAGSYNGSTSLRSRACSELDGLTSFSWFTLSRTPEAQGRAQEFVWLGSALNNYLSARWNAIGTFQWSLNISGTVTSIQSDSGVYAQRGIGIGGVWTSGTRPIGYVDSVSIDPPTIPAVLTGAFSGSDTLRIGAGGRDGAATYFNGQISCLLLSSTLVPRAAAQCLTGALSDPRVVYGSSGFRTPGDTVTAPVAHLVRASVNANGQASPGIDVKSSAYNPNALPLTVTVPDPPSLGTSAVNSAGEVIVTLPASAANITVLAPYTVSNGDMASKSVIRISASAVQQPPDETGDSLPAGYPAVPTFSGATVNVSSAAQLNSAIANTSPNADGSVRIRCAGGVNYGSVTIDRANVRFEIICTRPRFTGLNTTQRTGLQLTSQLDRTARQAVVIGDADPNLSNTADSTITSGIHLIPVRSGVTWIEGFDFRREQKIIRLGSVIGDVWIRKCRMGIAESSQIALGGTSSTAGRIILWETWHYSDGTIPGTPPQPDASYTDYGVRSYFSQGIYLYKCFLEGGISHYVSMKMGVKDLRIYNSIFMPWSNRQPTEINNIQCGQEGSKGGVDRTCGYARIVGNTFGGWAGHASTPQGIVSFQDCNGMLFDGNLVYAEVARLWRALANQNSGLDANDVGPVFAGRGGIRTVNNTLLGRPVVTCAQDLYPGSWQGGELHFAENSVNGADIPIGTVNSAWQTPTFGSNPGYRR